MASVNLSERRRREVETSPPPIAFRAARTSRSPSRSPRPQGSRRCGRGGSPRAGAAEASIFHEALRRECLDMVGYAELVDRAQRLDSLARICAWSRPGVQGVAGPLGCCDGPTRQVGGPTGKLPRPRLKQRLDQLALTDAPPFPDPAIAICSRVPSQPGRKLWCPVGSPRRSRRSAVSPGSRSRSWRPCC